MAPLSKIDPIYKEEEEAYKVRWAVYNMYIIVMYKGSVIHMTVLYLTCVLLHESFQLQSVLATHLLGVWTDSQFAHSVSIFTAGSSQHFREGLT